MIKESKPEFRKDLVSGDWILVASGRRKRPSFFKSGENKNLDPGVENCPFEDPQKSGNGKPVLWYPRPDTPVAQREDLKSWFVQSVPNKFPLLFERKTCPNIKKKGLAEYSLPAVGYHEVIITRDHNKTLAEMTLEEAMLVLKVYQERYRALQENTCVKYICIFHNSGESAGASIFHPHSQLVALPIIDPDIASSLSGSLHFYNLYRTCVHCTMIEQELREKTRVIKDNGHFVSVVPYAPRVSYEIRIYPAAHSSMFEYLTDEDRPYLADILQDALRRMKSALGNPDYNFFIHTSPVDEMNTSHYHWHIEIFPRGFKWAGLELGSGIEVVAVPPEEAAALFKKTKATK